VEIRAGVRRAKNGAAAGVDAIGLRPAVR